MSTATSIQFNVNGSEVPIMEIFPDGAVNVRGKRVASDYQVYQGLVMWLNNCGCYGGQDGDKKKQQ